MSIESPNFEGLDRWSFDARRIDKPWGWELIWAVAEQYVGKVLFVKAGESLSLQFHKEKDESWYVLDGRRRARARRRGASCDEDEGDRDRSGIPFPPGHRPPGSRPGRHHDPRGLDAAAGRRRPARG